MKLVTGESEKGLSLKAMKILRKEYFNFFIIIILLPSMALYSEGSDLNLAVDSPV